jgi:hypothetical protein
MNWETVMKTKCKSNKPRSKAEAIFYNLPFPARIRRGDKVILCNRAAQAKAGK